MGIKSWTVKKPVVEKDFVMNKRVITKIIIDIGMTVVLIFLMAYELVGRKTHEWLGVGMFLLFVAHHILNRGWIKWMFRGRYSPFRILQTISVILVLLSMLCSMVSGIVMSRYVFRFLDISVGRSWARMIHMLAAYWGFLCMSFHLGTNWKIMMGIAGKALKKKSYIRERGLKLAGIMIAAYGIYAFSKRKIGMYLFLQSMYVFFDYEEPLIFLMLDYAAVMGLFVWIGYYSSGILTRIKK